MKYEARVRQDARWHRSYKANARGGWGRLVHTLSPWPPPPPGTGVLVRFAATASLSDFFPADNGATVTSMAPLSAPVRRYVTLASPRSSGPQLREPPPSAEDHPASTTPSSSDLTSMSKPAAPLPSIENPLSAVLIMRLSVHLVPASAGSWIHHRNCAEDHPMRFPRKTEVLPQVGPKRFHRRNHSACMPANVADQRARQRDIVPRVEAPRRRLLLTAFSAINAR
jgi:hypothetical protein